MKLSVIIPVYNVEKYITKCIKSILLHRTNDIEIIIVNDGSTDNSLALATSLLQGEENVKIITQKNQGLSEARNIGFKNSSGKYAWFVDSDDSITEDAFNTISSHLNGADIIAIGYNIVDEMYQCTSTILPYKQEKQKGIDTLNNDIIIPAQFYIYKKEFLIKNKLSFYKGIYHEDLEFTPRMLYFAQSVESITKPLYNYLHRENSIVTSVNPQKAFDLITVASRLNSFKKSNQINNAKFSFIISLVLNNSLQNTLNDAFSKEFIIKLNNEIFKERNNILPHLKNSQSLKYIFEYYIFKLFPKHNVQCFKILKLFCK